MAFKSCELSKIPAIYRSFISCSELNPVQKKCFSAMFDSDGSAVISAPTGSGKTIIMEFAILRQLINDPDRTKKIVYIAPSKALCNERHKDWSSKMQKIYRKCASITGDTEDADEASDADLIVTTPEKWDSVTRRWYDNKKLLQSVSLVIIDEVHLLNDNRGSILEIITSRMKMMRKKSGDAPIRFVVASATMPNPEDLSKWLSDENGRSANCLTFGEPYRPVPLHKHVYSAPFESRNPFTFDISLNARLPQIMNEHSRGKPTLIFCSTRKSTESTAQYLAAKEKDSIANGSVSEDRKLQGVECVSAGYAYHHAGLSIGDRSLVERLFREGKIKALCCTSTLAAGVNLPAHLVIIKSTLQYGPQGFQEYSVMDIFQMMGRAGRPQFDTFGVAVIMTDDTRNQHYKDLCQGSVAIESHLHENLTETLNAEVALGTISDLETALLWLESTYLYARITKNPSHYHAGPKEEPQKYLRSKVHDAVQLLNQKQLIIVNEMNRFASTRFGAIMAKFGVKLKTMELFMNCGNSPSASKVLQLLSKAEEFAAIKFSAGDKGIINEALKESKVRFKETTGKIKEVWEKIFYSVQIVLGDVDIGGAYASNFCQEASHFIQKMCQISKGILEVFAVKKDGIALRNMLEILSCLYGRTWHDSPYNMKQLDKIGKVSSKTLYDAGICTLADLAKADGRRIELLLQRRAPFGNEISNSIKSTIPHLSLSAHQDSPFDYEIRGTIDETSRRALSAHARTKAVYILVLGFGSAGPEILSFQKHKIQRMCDTGSLCIRVTPSDGTDQMSVSLIVEEVSGINQHVVLPLANSGDNYRVQVPEEVNDAPPNLEVVLDDLNWSDISSPHVPNIQIRSPEKMPTVNMTPKRDYMQPAFITPPQTEEMSRWKLPQPSTARKVILSPIHKVRLPKIPEMKERKQIQKALEKFRFVPSAPKPPAQPPKRLGIQYTQGTPSPNSPRNPEPKSQQYKNCLPSFLILSEKPKKSLTISDLSSINLADH